MCPRYILWEIFYHCSHNGWKLTLVKVPISSLGDNRYLHPNNGGPRYAPYLLHRCPVSYKIRGMYEAYTGHLRDILCFAGSDCGGSSCLNKAKL
jgi:hypothetical protein